MVAKDATAITVRLVPAWDCVVLLHTIDRLADKSHILP